MRHMVMLVLILVTASDSLAQAPERLTLQRVWEIGRESDPITFMRVVSLAVTRDGEAIVADNQNRMVVRISRDGRFAGHVGRQGQGPGEYQMPAMVRTDSLIRVFDPMQRRVTEFTLTGERRSTRSLDAIAGLNVSRLWPTKGGMLAGATSPSWVMTGRGPAPGSNPDIIVFQSSDRGGRIDTLLVYHSGAAVFHPRSGSAVSGLAEAAMGPGGAWAMDGDSVVVVADGTSGEVRWIRVGSPPAVIRRGRINLPVRRTEDRDRSAALSLLRSQGRELPPDPVIILPPVWSIATHVVVMADRSVWIRNGNAHDNRNLWTVFDSGGQRLVQLPAGFHLLAGDREFLYGTMDTALGTQLVGKYRVVRRPS